MAWDVLTCHQKCQFLVATNRHGNRPEVLLQTPCFVARNKRVKRPEALLQTPCFVVASNTARNIPTSIKKKTFFFLHSVACNSTTIPSTCRRDVQRKGFWQIFACFQGEWRRERVYGGQTLVVYRTISSDRSVLGCVLHLGHPVTNLVDLSWKFGDKVLVLTFCWNVNTLRNIWHIQMWMYRWFSEASSSRTVSWRLHWNNTSFSGAVRCHKTLFISVFSLIGLTVIKNPSDYILWEQSLVAIWVLSVSNNKSREDRQQVPVCVWHVNLSIEIMVWGLEHLYTSRAGVGFCLLRKTKWMNNHADTCGVKWFTGKIRGENNNEHWGGVWWMKALLQVLGLLRIV